MSEIFVDTIKNKAGSTSLDSDKLPDMYSGSAKMWANLNGQGTISLRDSFNVSSTTDLATGKYTFTFTNAFADTNYSSPSAAADSTGGAFRGALPHDGDNVATTNYMIRIDNSSSTSVDGEYIHTATFGDLA